MNMREAMKIVGSATLIVGGLDCIWPTMTAYFSGGSIAKLWQFVASGVFGQRAFSMGMMGVLSGVIFHFMIMAAFSVVIYVLYEKIILLRRHSILSGLVYGVGMWVVMNFLVAPLSNTGRGFPQMSLDMIMSASFAISFVGHMIFGLLLVLITKRGLIAHGN